MNRVIHFEIQADIPKRASDFYHSVFGWQMKQWGDKDYWLITTGPDEEPGINGAIVKRPSLFSSEEDGVNAFICTIQVEDINAAVKAVVDHGGKYTVEIQHIEGVGHLAYCADTEGNAFAVLQEKKHAIPADQ